MDKYDIWKDPTRDKFDPNPRGRPLGWGQAQIMPQIMAPSMDTVVPVDTGPTNSTEAFRRGAKTNPFDPVFAAPAKSGIKAPGTTTIPANPLTPVIALPAKNSPKPQVNPLTPVFKDGGLVQGVKHYGKKC